MDERISALHAAAAEPDTAALLWNVPVLTATLTDIPRAGPGAPVWRPVHAPDQPLPWNHGAFAAEVPAVGSD
ncbi:hypothetical protein ABTZ58_38535 [Streptomyces sp. NPDC094143]|uniref:hypothetical protein n=1 Tax=Streptomyces sp. NPDC094143 TaxID=3155310 RepID=UPI0033248F6C